MPVQRITAKELRRLMEKLDPVAILDTRAPDAWKSSNVQIPGSIRVPPDEVQEHLPEIPHDRLIVAYCT